MRIKSDWFTPRNIGILSFLIFSAVMIVYHILMPITIGDDAATIELARNTDPWQHVVSRWNNWSSRWLVQYIAMYAYKVPILWRIVDAVLMITMPLSIAYIFREHKHALTESCALTLLFPIFTLCRAGWLSVTVNYVWPLAVFLMCMALTMKLIRSGGKWYHYILLAAGLFYATNLEGLAVVSLMTFGLLMVRDWVKDHSYVLPYLVPLIMGVIGVVTFLICPGNGGRGSQEMGYWLPEFGTFSSIEKVILALSQLSAVVFNPVTKILFVLFALTVLLLNVLKNGSVHSKMTSLLALALLLVCDSSKMTPEIMTLSIHDPNVSVYAFILAMFTVIGLLIYSTINLFDDKRNWDIMIIVLMAGFASYVAASLSPTLFAVGGRTAMFMFFSLIFSIVLLLSRAGYEMPDATSRTVCLLITCFIAVLVVAAVCVYAADIVNSPEGLDWGPFEIWRRPWSPGA